LAKKDAADVLRGCAGEAILDSGETVTGGRMTETAMA
jgi:hypothetical protein